MSNPTPACLHKNLKRVIKYFILVLDALGDSEMRWLAVGASWGRAVGDATTAYGYTEQTNVRLCPSAREVSQAEVVASWLAWLGKWEGPKAVPRLVNWAHDEPMWRMADKERCSVRTIAYRIDHSVEAIMDRFGGVELDLPPVDEPAEQNFRLVDYDPRKRATLGVFRDTNRATIGDVGVRQGTFDKVWIDGVGFMRDGRRLNNGHDKIDERRLSARR